MSDNINIHEIILQLVKTDLAFQESDLSKLLPIDKVYKGFGLYNGIHKIKFDPPEEYDKAPYEIKVNVDDDEERVNKLTQLNEDIRKYNEWASEQNRLRDEEIIKKEIPENSDKLIPTPIAVESKWFTPMEEYQMWQFITSKATPKKFRKSYMEDLLCHINCEYLYKLKEELDEDNFVIKFNKTIFDYIRQKVNEAKEYDSWDKENIWFEPNAEFIRWFHKNGIEINDVKSFNDNQSQSEYDELSYYKDIGCTQAELNHLRLYFLTQKYIEENDGTSIRNAVKKVYNSNKNIFPEWKEGSLNRFYHNGQNLSLNK